MQHPHRQHERGRGRRRRAAARGQTTGHGAGLRDLAPAAADRHVDHLDRRRHSSQKHGTVAGQYPGHRALHAQHAALVLEGATGLFANANTSPAQRMLAEAILSAVGISRWLGSEHDINAVTALSGSGPAYFFLLMEAMQEAGVALGLEPELARALTIQTALGAAKLAASSDVGPDELRRRVTSPNGTTQAALEQFESEDFRGLVERALSAAQKRSVELAG